MKPAAFWNKKNKKKNRLPAKAANRKKATLPKFIIIWLEGRFFPST